MIVNWRNGHSPSKPHFGSTVTTEPSSRKTTVWFDFIACDSFEVQKRSQLFIRTHNETLSIAAMCVS